MATTKRASKRGPAAEGDDKNRPWIANYPPLQAWLRKIEARCLRQEAFGSSYIELWEAKRGASFIVLVHANGHGWEVFTSGGSPLIDRTLKDATERLGLNG